MDDLRLGRLIRSLRQRRGWRQEDLAGRAGLGRTVVSDIEHGRLNGTRLATVRRVAAAVELSLEVDVRGLGADIDRVLDERHAALLGATSAWLTGLAWETVAEVSYSEFGERGSVDLLAWHEPSSSLLIIEIKTELTSVEATLRKHDEEFRLGPKVAAQRFGWRSRSVSRLVVFPDDRRERLRVAAHASVLLGTCSTMVPIACWIDVGPALPVGRAQASPVGHAGSSRSHSCARRCRCRAGSWPKCRHQARY